MADTVRADSAILTLLADNTSGAISAQDMRDAFITAQARGALDLRQYGVAGNGTTDDSSAVASWLAALISTGRPGYVPAGIYSVPDLSATEVSAPVTIIGAGRDVAVFDGEYDNTDPTTGLLAWLQVDAPLIIRGITFRNMTNVAAMADGTGRTGSSSTHYRYEDWRANWMTGDVALVEFRDCAFEAVRRPFLAAMQNEGWLLRKFVFIDNLVDDAWAGPTLIGSGFQQLRIFRNDIRNIDGTPAGFTTGGSPIRDFSTRGVQAGQNRSNLSDAEFASNYDWLVGYNKMHTIADTRTHGSEHPEIHGTDLRSGTNVHTFCNTIEYLTTATTDGDETEGMHFRDCHDYSSNRDYLRNAGLKEAAWAAKGNQARGRCIDLTVTNEDGYEGGGILYTGSNFKLVRPRVIGCGRADSTDRGVITFNGGSQTNIEIVDPAIIDCHTRHGIDIACTSVNPGWFTIRGGLITGQDAVAEGGNSTISGVIKRAGADIHLTIDGVEFADFSSPNNDDIRAIRLAAGADGDVVIRNCKIRLTSLRTGNLQWTASGSGTGEFYLEASGGGDPGVKRPKRVFEGGAAISTATLGSLTASTWNWGDNDTLGFSTVYIRLADDADPDTEAQNYVKSSTLNQGIFLEGTWTGFALTLLENDLAAATTPLNSPASPPTIRASGNNGIADTPVGTASAEETASFTLALTHIGKVVRCNHADTPIVVTIPPNSSVAFPVGTVLNLTQWGGSGVSFSDGGSPTDVDLLVAASASPEIAEQYGVATLWKQATDTWLLFGALADAS